jgi:phosphopantothenoylcysteine synthetase/decarboxylase
MTRDAQRFITPLAFKTLSRQAVVTDLYDEEEGWQPTHIKLADEADLLLIAPATANILAKLALGLADDALTCIALALNPKAKMLIAPAMNGKMWLHPATQQNVATLKSRGAEFIGPEAGLLSCGYEGLGRLWPVDEVARRAAGILK